MVTFTPDMTYSPHEKLNHPPAHCCFPGHDVLHHKVPHLSRNAHVGDGCHRNLTPCQFCPVVVQNTGRCLVSMFFFWGGVLSSLHGSFPHKKNQCSEKCVACFANFGTWFEKAAPIVTHTHTHTHNLALFRGFCFCC